MYGTVVNEVKLAVLFITVLVCYLMFLLSVVHQLNSSSVESIVLFLLYRRDWPAL